MSNSTEQIGPVNEAAAASDTADSGLNGLIKRLLQKLTTGLTVAGSVDIRDGVTPAILATVRDYATSNPLAVALTDATGAILTSLGVSSIAAGTNLIGDVGLQGRATGGLSIFRSIDVDETEEAVKASAGTLYTLYAFNATAAPLYLKFYNGTVGDVVVGTTTPVLTLPIPGLDSLDGAGFIWTIPQGLAFSAAITVAATTGLADNDTGAPAANAVVVNLGYQ